MADKYDSGVPFVVTLMGQEILRGSPQLYSEGRNLKNPEQLVGLLRAHRISKSSADFLGT